MQEMQETWVLSLGQEDPLEEGTATQSSTLACRIPQTEEPGGPWGCKVTHTHTHARMNAQGLSTYHGSDLG